MEQKESTQAIRYRLDKHTNPNSRKEQAPGMMITIGRKQDQHSEEYKPQKRASPRVGQRYRHGARLALLWTKPANVLARHDSKAAHCIPRHSPRVRFTTASAKAKASGRDLDRPLIHIKRRPALPVVELILFCAPTSKAISKLQLVFMPVHSNRTCQRHS